MDMEIRAIKPKRPIVNVAAVHNALHGEMTGFVVRLQGKFKDYPPQMATKTGYRRTGTLMRSWHYTVDARPGLIVGRVGSNPLTFMQAVYQPVLKSGRLGKGRRGRKPYAKFVMGKEQSREMKRRGWKRVGDTLKQEWPGQVKRFQQAVNRAR